MHIDFTPVEGNKTKTCSLEHRGMTLYWVVNYFKEPRPSTANRNPDDEVVVVDHDLFKYVNQYFKSLSESKQDKLFDLYSKAREILTDVEENEELVISLRDVVRQILDFQTFKEVHRFLRIHTDIQNPMSVLDTFVEDEAGRNKKNKTYVRHEYEELVTLTFLFRLLLPVYGEYIARISAYNEAFSKELRAFELASTSDIMESDAMLRLIDFVENTIPPDKDTNKSPALIEGVSSANYVTWLLSSVVLRRLMIGNLQDTNNGATLVSFIYGYIRYKATNDSSFGGLIKDKLRPQGNSDDVNALSNWEEYRIKQMYPAGDIVLVEADLSDPVDLYWLLCSGLDEDESTKFEPGTPNEEFEMLRTKPIEKGQMGMLKYVLAPLVSHRLLDDCRRPFIYNAMIAASAYLKRIGMLEHAILLTAVKTVNKAMSGSTSAMRIRMSQEDIDKLKLIYPFERKTMSRQTVVETKPAYQLAADAFDNEFKKSEWHITLPYTDIVQFTNGLKVSRTYVCPSDMKPFLYSFFIQMDESLKRITINRKKFLEKINEHYSNQG